MVTGGGTMQTRRNLLKAAALFGTTFFVPGGYADALQDPPDSIGADDLRLGAGRVRITRGRLHGFVGSDFAVQTAAGSPVTLRLVEVADVPSAAAAGVQGAQETFAARFEDSSGTLLSQGTYTLTHEVLGRRQWFLVPVGQATASRQVYEAIFYKAPRGAGRPPRRLHKGA